MSGIRYSEQELAKMVNAGNPIAAQALKRYDKVKPSSSAKSKSRKRPSGPSKLEQSFALQCKADKLPEPRWGKDELLFHPTRKWRFDFAWEEYKVAVEAEGGTFTHMQKRTDKETGKKVTQKSRHLTPTGYHEDCVKYAEAAILGWTVIRADAKMIKNGMALQLLKRALEAKGCTEAGATVAA